MFGDFHFKASKNSLEEISKWFVNLVGEIGGNTFMIQTPENNISIQISISKWSTLEGR